jgi:hypothetical protein
MHLQPTGQRTQWLVGILSVPKISNNSGDVACWREAVIQ